MALVYLGAYTGTEIWWSAGETTLMRTTAKNFATGGNCLFEAYFPAGAESTSTQTLPHPDAESVMVEWPAFTTVAIPPQLSWQGSFVSPVNGKASTGPQGGPTVFFDPAAAAFDEAYCFRR